MITIEDLKLLKDVEVEVRVELSTIVRNFEFLLNIKEGDIIPLEKSLEDFLIMHVGNIPFAIGEMTNINEKYGIRIVDLIKEDV
ncbi:flagellar motor switch protein FliN/FliY [Sulfurihydrogenibium azorense Az-Fu1]|jgi:flagellar motor switch protein FliN/FliY|uniref:Flagellar motor switch protein FliN/FliY n=1 Tax=Sulfurihydrogenibium azorense (strain DSM 15241 / OCM 825 / Az-Fu1) TaxID=204536 RepID=C1DW32_SULAA|nr:FliM/FliN family flagellar motor switch protein [Sulfurihydrogenibium azorense]ACN98849.1 flagellar motor switch protein FliN/FliY [Sulfurihydrogenibium azorense Az-Fu1]